MNKLDLRKIIIFLLLIIAVFGLIFFSEWISFEALKENRAEIAEFRDKKFSHYQSLVSWIFYVILVVFFAAGRRSRLSFRWIFIWSWRRLNT